MNPPLQKILIVDDNPSLLYSVREYLKRAQYEVYTAGNGKVGLECAVEKSPDLIVCDLRMPEMDGFALLQNLQANPRTAPIPVLILTASEEHADLIKGLSDGAEDYMTKPFYPQELLARINAILRRTQRTPPPADASNP